MNEEEKKAVERIEDTFYSDLGKGINKFQKITLYEDSIRDVRILLNLIEEMKNCINILDDELKERNKTINEKEIIIEKLQKENEELKEYIAIAPNLDEMTATKYRNIQQDAYIQGRAEEQQKAEQIIYENYIPIQKIKDKIEEIQKEYNKLDKQVDEYIRNINKDVSTYYENKERISIMQTLSYFINNLQELIEEREEK